ncbi:MAG: hypothetical protein AB8G15_04285 [Saprospiraceae bacterium]
MKKINLLLFTCIFVTLISCKKDNFQGSKLDAAAAIEAFNQGKIAPHHALEFQGKIEILSTTREILIFVNAEKEDRKLFILQTRFDDQNKKIRQSFSEGQVFYFKRQLVVQSNEGKRQILFHLDEEIPDFLQMATYERSLKGYGLGLQENFKLVYQRLSDFEKLGSVYESFKTTEQVVTNRAVSDNPSIIGVDAHCKCCTGGVIDAAACTQLANNDCDAGGPGALSCSLSVSDGTNSSSCNISCASGSTPCCWEATEDSGDDDGDGAEQQNN